MGGVCWVGRGPQPACWGSEGFDHAVEEGLSVFGMDSWVPLEG